tara:strand:+ start:27793 stop:27918 length:126 start_codon:yes stop_codon:yes gene_type:complete
LLAKANPFNSLLFKEVRKITQQWISGELATWSSFANTKKTA